MKKTFGLWIALFSATFASAANWNGETSAPRDTVIGESTYYLISSAAELAWFSAEVNSGKSNINAKLTNDISFYEGVVTTSNHCSKNFPTIGYTDANAFAGIFDGDGHVIEGAYHTSTSPSGAIFSYISKGAVVKNFTLANSYFFMNYRRQSANGGLFYSNSGLVENVTIKSNVIFRASSTSCAGCEGTGIASFGKFNQESGILRSIKNEADITADVPIGIVQDNKGLIDGAINTGTMTGGNWANGLIDANYATGIIRRSINAGNISSRWNTVRAIAGGNSGLIELCINSGTLNEIRGSCAYGNGDAAVFVTENKNGGVISNNMNIGNVTGGCKRAGIVLINAGTVKNNFFVTTSTQTSAGPSSLINTQTTSTNANYKAMAWSLNTTNGTEPNSGIWTQNDTINNGYPYFADGENSAIYKVTFNINEDVTADYYKDSFVSESNPIPANGFLFVSFLDQDGNVFLGADSLYRDLYLTAHFSDAENPEFLVIFKDANANIMTALITNKADSTLTAFPTAPEAATGMRFKGWLSTSGSYMTTEDKFVKNDTLIATYEPLVYKISFKADGETLKEINVPLNEMPDFGKAPEKKNTAAYTYTFKEWTPEVIVATKDETYEAVFDSVLNEYNVKIIALKDTLLVTKLYYGSTLTLPSAVKHKGYQFDGWNDSEGNSLGEPGDKITVKGNISIIAEMTATNSILTSKATALHLTITGLKIQIAQAPIGEKYTLLDSQGRSLFSGISSTNFAIGVPHAGLFFIKIGNQIKTLKVK